MAIPISHLYERAGSEKPIEKLRLECYELRNRLTEALIKCEISADGNRLISEEYKQLFAQFRNSQNILNAIETDMLSSARKGLKFKSEREQGAQADHTKEIYRLVAENPEKTAGEIGRLITHPKGKAMSARRLENVVSDARKKQRQK